MARIVYRRKNFNAEHTQIIRTAEAICDEYDRQGFAITLRQLYYQFVARGLLANKQQEYKRLGDILNDARMAGELDWEYLVDRTRNLVSPRMWSGPQAALKAVAEQYQPDLWADQHHRVEVWIEKDAGISVIEGVCDENRVPYFSCRGYTSVSELWNAAQRIGDHLYRGNRVTVLHIGDHDPSGIDMTRDIRDRLATFLANDWNRSNAMFEYPGVGLNANDRIRDSMRKSIRRQGGVIRDDQQPWRVKRIALTIDQIEHYDPPPNPAKQTDSRFERYMQDTGLDESWELDALAPDVLANLIQSEIDSVRDEDAWGAAFQAMETDRFVITAIADDYENIRPNYASTEN